MEEENQVQEEIKSEVTDTRKGLSIAAMVLGMVSLVFFCIWYISIPCAVLAIIFGIIGKKRANQGMAVAGLVMGIIAAALWVVLFVLVFVFGVSSALIGSSSL